MKMIIWNCQGAFRKKNAEILSHKPDILIVPECESTAKLKFDKLTPQPFDCYWYGDNDNKGIGIFSYTDYKIELLKTFNPNFRYVIPLLVSNENNAFILLAIWAMNNEENPIARYIGQVWNAINYYQPLLAKYPVILAGDFNSNQIWDKKTRVGNHTDVANMLKIHDIISLYHQQEKEAHGQESISTFFMHRNLKKPYHIDYFFAPKSIADKDYKLTLGQPEHWLQQSDHIPLFLEIEGFDSKLSLTNSYYAMLQNHIEALSGVAKNKLVDEINSINELAEQMDAKEATVFEQSTLIEKISALKSMDKYLQVLH